jgi:peptide/nickel transport system permease protein
LSGRVTAFWRATAARPAALVAAGVLLLCIVCALCAPWLAPHDTRDLAQLELADAMLPPSWLDGGRATYVLGTDDQGRDVLSAALFGARISLVVGLAAVVLSLAAGVLLGLVAGFAGGVVDALLMRLCDVVSAFPSILVALLVDGTARALLPDAPDALAVGVLVVAIALTGWVPYARTVRAATRVERHKDYVSAARVIGVPTTRILWRHLLPNVTGAAFVLAPLQVASAIVLEATLSFLGVGVPPTAPSLGTLIRVGNDFLAAGQLWMAVFPGLFLALLAFAINVLGDSLRDAARPDGAR